MYALFLILNDIYMLDDIHEVLYECGVGATTMDSMGMGKVLLEHNVHMTLFTSIRMILEGKKPYNKTIISVIRSEEKLNHVIERLNEKIGDITQRGVGFMFVVPVVRCEGFNAEESDEDISLSY
ncbi:hypothetical protein [Abyssisolibacter fermentans]|uniref:hypothetical protein n=1 Tax=Abyssisolibacter fermentans TaxID=1766203 RepID=UPI00082CBD31|nr:hypothetical protein [Abyssisolibacter fermentans]